MLIQKFGDSILSEASANIIENGLQEALDDVDKKPLAYVIPELKGEPNLDLGRDFSFTVTYDTFPEIDLGTYKGLEIVSGVRGTVPVRQYNTIDADGCPTFSFLPWETAGARRSTFDHPRKKMPTGTSLAFTQAKTTAFTSD